MIIGLGWTDSILGMELAQEGLEILALERGADEVFPELDGSSLVTAQSPTGLIFMILHGGELPSTAKRPARLRMPGFAARLSDDEVATLASFLRQAWTNNADPVPTAAVADLRRAVKVD